jgi:hypothetical protein
MSKEETGKKIYNWIPFIRFGKQMDRTYKIFEVLKVAFFIVI